MKTAAVALTSIFCMTCITGALYAQSASSAWSAKDGSIRNVDARGVISSPGAIYLATKNAIYRRAEKDSDWRSIYSIPAGENEINCLAGSSSLLFVGTKRGLLRSEDRGGTWKNVFRSINAAKNDVLCVNLPEETPGIVMIGTQDGIFVSIDHGTRWTDYSGILKNKPVRRILSSAGSIYAATDSGVYMRIDGGREWERMLVKSGAGDEREAGALETDEVEEENNPPVKCVVGRGPLLYAAIEKSILSSNDGGKSWAAFPCQGLDGDINDILLTGSGKIRYAATTKGIFEYISESSRWAGLYRGLEKDPNATALSFAGEDENILWAVTDLGLYKFESGKYLPGQSEDIERSIGNFRIVSDSEPPFRDLQKAAMDFAEVDPEKIKKWRRGAKMKSLVPKVSLGIDKNRSTNTEIYTSATRDYAVIGPDDFSNGWDVSVSWELGDLIWSDAQTSIDVRSRLTTQLRNDILDGLRRIYFERKRVQFELAAIPADDLKARFEKEIRLQELTQALDDLTGNFFSDKMKKMRD